MIRIHREGRNIVTVTVIVAVLLVTASAYFLPAPIQYAALLLSLVFIILVLRFFRVPARRPFLDERTIVSPADGKIVAIEQMQQEEYLSEQCIQLSIFMSIHDVHINYYPVSGKIAYKKYFPGHYLVARYPKSSQQNERSSLGIETPSGNILVRQVAGYVARRIRCYATRGDRASQGEEMGFIKFGSRLDLFLPLDTQILVQLGQRVTGGVTPVARFK